VCKHVCFVLLRVLRLEDLEFFTRSESLRLTAEEMRFFAEAAEGRITRSVDDVHSTSRSVDDDDEDHDAAAEFFVRRKDVDDTDECPVCYRSLCGEAADGAAGADVCWCPACSNAIHASCAERWLRNAPLRTCVFCRSTAWRNFPLLTPLPSRRRRWLR